eukprot:TRINITY_DN8178_c0_g1_i1.p1 TRINITY_DN8178_c0_g1~~TRINITY_DN8178_c0_g1_i1.p1  ORF type:complete len:1174 (+),score=270.35 TRINITY_DN8178_c0_g1_i1:45-3524(+)
MFGALKKRLKGGDSSPSSPAVTSEGNEEKVSGIGVEYHLGHSLGSPQLVVWDGARNVLIAASQQLVWVIGQGWCKRRFRLCDDEGEVVALTAMVDKPSCVVCTTNSVAVLDYDTGLMHTCVAVPGQYTFTSATTPVSHTWTVLGRSDGVVQGIDVNASQTSFKFDLKDIPNASINNEAPADVTHVISRMFHRQIVIVNSKRTGICQINLVRKELLGRFTVPDDTELTSLAMCAIDKYLLAGISDGRVVVWKANDEPKNKRDFIVPRMMVVHALLPLPITGIECYGSGTEDIIPCRWMAGGRVIEARLKPKEKSPRDVSLNCIYEGSTELQFTGRLCGMVTTPWPERTEPPQAMFLTTESSLYCITYSPTTSSWATTCVTQMMLPKPVMSAILVPSFIPELLSHAPRVNTFPWNAGGKSDFASKKSDASLIISCDAHGSLAASKVLLSHDAICPQPLRVLDDCNTTVSDAPGSVAQALQGNVILTCNNGRLHWIDMITLNMLHIDTCGEEATCAQFVSSPLNAFFIGTHSGVIVVKAPGVDPISVSVSSTPITSLAVAQCGSEWVISAVSVNAEGSTALSVVSYDPSAPLEAMEVEEHYDPTTPHMYDPRPLRVLGCYMVCGGEDGTSRPELVAFTKASEEAKEALPAIKGLKNEKQLPFNMGPMAKGVCLPPAGEMCIVVRLPADAMENTPEIKMSLCDAAGFDALVIVIRKTETGCVDFEAKWYDGTFKEPVVLQEAEALEVPLKEGEDNLLVARFHPEKAEVATVGSVDSARVPTSQQLVKAMQRVAAGDINVNGGPMWSVFDTTEITITSCEDAYHKQSVLSAVCEPKGAVKMLQIFDDIWDPDAAPEPLLNVLPEADEAVPYVPMIPTDHTLVAMLVKSKGGVVRQVTLCPGESGHSTLEMSPPLRINGKTVIADKLAVTPINNRGICSFVLSGNTLQLVQLPITSSEAHPLLSYTSESLNGMTIIPKYAKDTLHLLGIGDCSSLLHLVLSEEQDAEIKCDILDENEDLEGPFATLPMAPSRPQVKAPGMGTMTMKSMFKNHKQEVQHIDQLILKVVEEDFDDFTTRVLPPEHRKRLEREVAERREQEGKKNATANSVNEVKDLMDKNRELLLERGEKISELEENTREIAQESENFYQALRAYNEKQKNKKWWQL